MRFIVIIVGLLSASSLLAQKYDYNWLLGGSSNKTHLYDQFWGKSRVEFDNLSKVEIEFDTFSDIRLFMCNNAISDKNGKYLFTYNGYHIENTDRKIMQNSENLSESGKSDDGEAMTQAGLIIPFSGSDSLFALFHLSSAIFDLNEDEIYLAGNNLYYSVIDMSKNNGLGAVTIKKQLLISDTMDFGKLTAVKHANGADWWVMIPGGNNNKIHRILFAEGDPEVLEPIVTDLKHLLGVGQAIFSNDGRFYANYSNIGSDIGCELYLYRFDRCEGLLSQPLKHQYEKEQLELGGIAFSPDSKILYLMAFHSIFQFDLTSDDILSTKNLVAESNGFLDTLGSTGFIIPHNFGMSQLGPDGKIYICPFPNLRVMTTIDYPNIWGEGCMVNQASIISPSLKFTVPTFPNYRLGPLEGSPCDTLGIVNFPLSRWRADQSEGDYLEFRMVDVSDYEPTEWHWDFGDGSTSEERNPTHSFSQDGIYEICLTVSNAHGSDTSCETFQVGSTSISEEELGLAVSVYPNPVQEDLFIDISGYYPGEARIIIYDIQGRQVKEQRVYHGSNYVYVGNFAAGMYVYKVEDGGVEIKVGKVTKI